MTALRQLPVALALSASLLATGASAATVIDTAGGWNGTSFMDSWGALIATRVFGQSVTAPAGTSVLTGFSFNIRDTRVPNGYSAFVYAWDGAKITGPALFSLTGQSVGGGGTSNFLPVSFSTSVAVNPGSQYMLFLSTIDEQVQGEPTVWGYRFGDAYAAGSFFYKNTINFDTLFTPWANFIGSSSLEGDLAFTATFDGTTVVPVPGALGLMLSGVAALGFLGRRRRKA